jgi:pimeloyl-ACP methyl ester carboxylesterase
MQDGDTGVPEKEALTEEEAESVARDHIGQTRAIDQKAAGLLTVVAIVFAVSLGTQLALTPGLRAPDALLHILILAPIVAQLSALAASGCFLMCLRMVPSDWTWVPELGRATDAQWAEFAERMKTATRFRKSAFRIGWRLTSLSFA